MLFHADKFTGGLNTHKDADHLSPDEGVTAQDCMVGTGSLQPLPALVTAAPSGECNALRLKLDNPTWGVVEYGGETYISGMAHQESVMVGLASISRRLITLL